MFARFSLRLRAVAVLTSITATMLPPIVAQAAFNPGARITFTFDDGADRIFTNAAPILKAHNFPAVLYGETGPLTSGEDWVMTWEQVQELKNQGWEIGSHTVTHPNLTTVTDAQLTNELVNSKNTFAQHGHNTTSFATPMGAYNTKVLRAVAKYYTQHRAAWGGTNVFPGRYNDYEVWTLEAAHNIPPETVMGWVDEAIANNQWLVILLHDVVDGVPAEYEYNKNDFKKIVDYVATRPIKVTTMTENIQLAAGANLVQNPSFETAASGFASNWTRSNATYVTLNTANFGNFPSPKNSIRLIGNAAADASIESAFINVTNEEHLFKMFLDATTFTSGGAGVWVSEFDANNAYLGGQWLGGVFEPYFGTKLLPYTPTNSSVKKVKLYLYVAKGSKMTMYLDTVELRTVGTGTTPPASSSSKPASSSSSKPASSSSAPASPNLVPNGNFEAVTGTFATGWNRTNTTVVTLDSANNGTAPTPTRSIKITGSATQNELMSPVIPLAATLATYDISFFQRMVGFQTGGTALWVNEFDANGNWLSGQWLGGTYQAFTGMKTLPYTPTSAAVRSASIHLFTEEGSAMTLYLDEVSMKKR